MINAFCDHFLICSLSRSVAGTVDVIIFQTDFFLIVLIGKDRSFIFMTIANKTECKENRKHAVPQLNC